MLKTALQNTFILCLSLLLCIGLLEGGLRFFYPRYHDAASASFERDALRIYTRKPKTRRKSMDPDRKTYHYVKYNNYALAHTLNFEKEELDKTTNIAFFGDSFVENIRLSTCYTFTRLLYRLLNAKSDSYQVLNFGVDGYGTDQSYLYYKHSELSPYLKYVFYVFSENDLRNIHENRLFTLNASGEIEQHQATKTNPFLAAVSRLHATYFFLELYKKIDGEAEEKESKAALENFYNEQMKKKLKESAGSRFRSEEGYALTESYHQGKPNKDFEQSHKIFLALLKDWKKSVEANGGEFFVVFLPRPHDHLMRKIVSEEFKVIDLFEEFQQNISNFDWKDYYFKYDPHWKKDGNYYAAIFLFKHLQQMMGIELAKKEKITETLYRYYEGIDGCYEPKKRDYRYTL